jgi:sterol desaturase/sphingolipid hydroxylase (fatty acid hydroxylase superfamily)
MARGAVIHLTSLPKKRGVQIQSTMAILAFPLLITLLLVTYCFPGAQIQLYQLILTNKISSPVDIFTENYLLWFPLYSLAYLLFYVQPFRNLFKFCKLNPNYPPFKLVTIEFLRSFRGIFICSLFESLIHFLRSSNGRHSQAWKIPGVYDSALPLDQLPPHTLLLSAIFLFLWGDLHFYWTHRLLHLPFFYKNVHKYHHESFNPNPFSGLSMHWFESSVYFSSALLLGLIGYCPLFLVRLMFKGLIIFPLEGHNGYGSWSIESSNNHYIHHSKFNWNYGSSPLWDHLMKTNYPTPIVSSTSSSAKSTKKMIFSSSSDQQRYEESLQQAKEVGCEMSDDYCEPSVATPAPSKLK